MNCNLVMCDRPAADGASWCRPHQAYWRAVWEDDAATAPLLTPEEVVAGHLEAVALIEAMHPEPDEPRLREILDGSPLRHWQIAVNVAALANLLLARVSDDRDAVLGALRTGLIDGGTQ